MQLLSWRSAYAEHSGLAALQKDPVRRARWERALVQFQCQVFVASWTGVIRCCLTLLVCLPRQ